MTRLPIPGDDVDTWGSILNDFLGVSHQSVGTLKNPYTHRGAIATSTTYNPWDVVVYEGRPILVVQQFTTGSSQPVFVSGANYVPFGSVASYYAYDWGVRGDQNEATAAANTANLKTAIQWVKAAGGGVLVMPRSWTYVAKDGANAWAVELLEHVYLQGQGMYGSRINLSASQNCTLIKMHTSTNGTSDGNAMVCGISDITLAGNRTNQSSGTGHGIDMTTNPEFTSASGDSAFDTHHNIVNVRVRDCRGDGVYIHGRSASYLENVHSWNNDGHGFTCDFDTLYVGCQAEGNGLNGFNRISQASGCKAFGNGRVTVDDTNGHGFYFDRAGSLSGAHSQNNYGHGVRIDHEGVQIDGLVSDSNNHGMADPAIWVGCSFSANGKKCRVSMTSKNETQGSPVGDEQYALEFHASATGNSIDVMQYAVAPSTVTAVSRTAIPAGNHVRANGVDVTTVLPDMNDVTVTAPADGHVLTWEAATSQWKNLPSGSTAFFGGVFGDGSDSTATLDGTATVAWASKAGSVYTMTRDAFLTGLTINSGSTLKPAGFKVFCTGTVTNNGLIDNAGADGAADGTAGTTAGSSSGALCQGAGGGAGNTGAGSNGSNGATQNALVGIGNGGAGGAGASGAGGNGTFAAQSSGAQLRSVTPVVTGVVGFNSGSGLKQLGGAPSGGGGGGDGAVKGGGGGGGGGAVVLLAHAVNNGGGTINVKGGNGGSPASGNAGGGGGGGGGLVFVGTLTSWTAGSAIVAGGTKGTHSGTAVDGANGSTGQIINVVVA